MEDVLVLMRITNIRDDHAIISNSGDVPGSPSDPLELH